MNNKADTIKWLVIVICCLLVLFVVMGKNLVYTEPLEPADVIVVLSGNDDIRLQTAVNLYNNKYAFNIMLTNTGNMLGDYGVTYSQFQKEQVEKLNVPSSAIFIAEFEAKNTGQEATGIIDKMYELGMRSAIIVTDNWHIRRVKMIFDDSFSNTGFHIEYAPAIDPTFDENMWWLSSDGWNQVIGEYARMAGYLIKKNTNIPDYPDF